MVYVYRPSIQNPPQEFKMQIKSEVGGFIGIGRSAATTHVFFDKNQYYMGERARIRIICDNTHCKKDIQSFKVKLMRIYEGQEHPGRFKTVHSSYIYASKESGCSRG